MNDKYTGYFILLQGEIMSEYDDYPKIRPNAENNNDDMVCFFCKVPVKTINGQLENHDENCAYRRKKEE